MRLLPASGTTFCKVCALFFIKPDSHDKSCSYLIVDATLNQQLLLVHGLWCPFPVAVVVTGFGTSLV